MPSRLQYKAGYVSFKEHRSCLALKESHTIPSSSQKGESCQINFNRVPGWLFLGYAISLGSRSQIDMVVQSPLADA